ncbi:MAG: hypothetical protein ACMXYA_01875 [Candidatus Woesearchaeota archaeon]
MAKKEESHSFINTIFHSVKDVVQNGIVNHVKTSTEQIADKVQKELDYIIHHFLQQFIAVVLIVTGLVFLSIGFMFSLREFVQLTPAMSFIVSGVIVILLASWYQYATAMKYKLEKYKRRDE